jgi:iron complex transport system substrate-binding protein
MSRLLVAVAAFSVLIAGCSGGADDLTTNAPVETTTAAVPTTVEQATDTSSPTTYVGADGVESDITDISRIVSLSGDITEAVYAMGLGDNMVGRDVTTIYPEEATSLPIVGIGRYLTAEGVLAESPTLVLGDTQTAPLEAIEQIRSAGVPVVIFEVPTSFDALYEKARAIGTALGVPNEGEALATDIEAAVDSALATVTPLDPVPGVAFIYTRGPDVMLLFGAGMTTEPIIEAAGGRDVGAASGVVGTVNVTPEALVAASPDVIVVPQEGLETLGGIDGLLAIPGFAETPAGRSRRILSYPEGDFLTFGPRIGVLLEKFISDLRTTVES